MINVNVIYPNEAGSRFDLEYYLQRHIPLVRERLGSACKGVSVDSGISGPMPGSSPLYHVIAALTFESLEAFQAALAPHVGEIMSDIPNYTNVQALIQVSQVKL